MSDHMHTPRPEHPWPQFQRVEWRSLPADIAGLFEREITIPLSPESELSGVGYTDYIDTLDYHRQVDVPAEWSGNLILLHFGASAFMPISMSITTGRGRTLEAARRSRVSSCPGESAALDVRVQDFISAAGQAGGKQSHYARSYGAFYTPTAGIWQTAWLEAVDRAGPADVHVIPRIHGGAFTCIPRYRRVNDEAKLRVTGSRDGASFPTAIAPCRDGVPVHVAVPNAELWLPPSPTLYSVTYEVEAGGPADVPWKTIVRVCSDAALRGIVVSDGPFYLNKTCIYLRFVLDQGFYLDGIWTAPADEVLKRDIELSMHAGSNGARLHRKVFEDRYHYWSDHLGYLTWAEWPSQRLDYNSYPAAQGFLNEIRETVAHLGNYPSIIAWTPFNESWRDTNARWHYVNHTDAFRICHDTDPTRPVNDASGYIHHFTDIYTVHTYTQDPARLNAKLAMGDSGQPFRNHADKDTPWEGQPYVVDEFGGIKWTGERETQPKEGAKRDPTKAWRYGNAPRSDEEFFARLSGQIDALLSHEHIAGYCYTQLTDVQQEQNGVYF